MAAVPEQGPPHVEVKERLQRFDILLQHLHRLRANLAVDNTMPSALRELHKLQALQMLSHHQNQRHPLHHRRLHKHFHGGVLPLLPPLPPLLSPEADPRRLPYMPPGFSPPPQQQQQQQHQQQQDIEGGQVKQQKSEWDEEETQVSDVIHEEMDHQDGITSTEESDIAQPIDASSHLESEEDLEDDDTVVHDLLAEEILAESKEVQEETENLASENGDELNLPFLPPIMNIELIKVCH